MYPKVRRFVPVARWKRGLMSCRHQMAGMRCDLCRCPAHEMVYSMRREEEALQLQAGVLPPHQEWLLLPDLGVQRSRCSGAGRGCHLLPAALPPGWPENGHRRMLRSTKNKHPSPGSVRFIRCSQSM